MGCELDTKVAVSAFDLIGLVREIATDVIVVSKPSQAGFEVALQELADKGLVTLKRPQVIGAGTVGQLLAAAISGFKGKATAPNENGTVLTPPTHPPTSLSTMVHCPALRPESCSGYECQGCGGCCQGACVSSP